MGAMIAAHGRLVADPEIRESRAGLPWATARLACPMPKPYGAAEDADPPTLWLGVTVFGQRDAANLTRHRKGESLSIAGRLELRSWTGRDGERREGFTVIADSVIGPRSARPTGGKRRQDAAPPAAPDRPLDDPIPF